MIQSLVAMPGAVFTGWIYDQTQSYTYAVMPFIVIYALAGLALWQRLAQTATGARSLCRSGDGHPTITALSPCR